ncbi:Speedy protein A [Liparis tanakae]|uniref:Speedy protein A n=1 Tax=Liparis tanakae TaxID=230148 RepID=A0A4Z2GDZ3_9TELE|nr:Speedy protein A [Liparis tanakae]
MMKLTRSRCQASPSTAAAVKPGGSRPLQTRRGGLRLKRANGQEAPGPPGKGQLGPRRVEMYRANMTMPPTIVIQRQEMASFFRLFGYLLAMTFVYFKRARFTIAEYTRKNFFIALYLANTMEEDEEESKYEIFPWVLGKNWRKHFPRFLQQRDKLWARIEYRAAVSRRCCEEDVFCCTVMAIVSLHLVWRRERSEHHSGARRQYGERGRVCIPRGPLALPVSCPHCKRGAASDRGFSASPSDGCLAQTPSPAVPHPFTSTLSLEVTPPRAAACHRRAEEMEIHTQHSFCCSAELPRDESSCGSSYDPSMDWIISDETNRPRGLSFTSVGGLLPPVQDRSFPDAVAPVFLEGRGHHPVSDLDLHDAFAQQGQTQTPEPLQQVDDLCDAGGHRDGAHGPGVQMRNHGGQNQLRVDQVEGRLQRRGATGA